MPGPVVNFWSQMVMSGSPVVPVSSKTFIPVSDIWPLLLHWMTHPEDRLYRHLTFYQAAFFVHGFSLLSILRIRNLLSVPFSFVLSASSTCKKWASWSLMLSGFHLSLSLILYHWNMCVLFFPLVDRSVSLLLRLSLVLLSSEPYIFPSQLSILSSNTRVIYFLKGCVLVLMSDLTPTTRPVL